MQSKCEGLHTRGAPPGLKRRLGQQTQSVNAQGLCLRPGADCVGANAVTEDGAYAGRKSDRDKRHGDAEELNIQKVKDRGDPKDWQRHLHIKGDKDLVHSDTFFILTFGE